MKDDISEQTPDIDLVMDNISMFLKSLLLRRSVSCHFDTLACMRQWSCRRHRMEYRYLVPGTSTSTGMPITYRRTQHAAEYNTTLPNDDDDDDDDAAEWY
jgi:hypothetical protein